jgi:hypothetical protein
MFGFSSLHPLSTRNSNPSLDLSSRQPDIVPGAEDKELLLLNWYPEKRPTSTLSAIQPQSHSPKIRKIQQDRTIRYTSQPAYPTPSTVNAPKIQIKSNDETTMISSTSIVSDRSGGPTLVGGPVRRVPICICGCIGLGGGGYTSLVASVYLTLLRVPHLGHTPGGLPTNPWPAICLWLIREATGICGVPSDYGIEVILNRGTSFMYSHRRIP